MIKAENGFFHIATKSSSYIMRVLDTGLLDHVHYGSRIDDETGIENVSESFGMNLVTIPYFDEEHPRLFPARILSEYPTSGSGDTRESALEVDYGNGLSTLTLLYRGCRIIKGKEPSFPAHALSDDETETLEIDLEDEAIGLGVRLRYTVYEKEDVILRSASIGNGTGHCIRIKGAASLSVDFPYDDFDLISFDGAWARERNEHRRSLLPGITVLDSRLGVSSSEHSPLCYLVRRSTGEAFGFNLIYSGNHRESIDVSPFGKTRIVSGINPWNFEWVLESGESFETPEAVMTYSASGIDDAAIQFSHFAERFIIRGEWKGKERPVLVNSWEAAYFDISEEKLLKLADKAAELGFELFVLDDGWFGSRRDDTKGLGDWVVSPEVFPNGLRSFGEKIKERGLMFGIWIEPEMVNPDSDLYRAHPDWVVAIPGRRPAMCRHQLTLDITRSDVRGYLFEHLAAIFSDCGVDYVKWDMNRTITDFHSENSDLRSMGEFTHRYVLGFYDLMDMFVKRFPRILFEGCASGGNRFDLGTLCFMPQIWTSDNTDLLDRIAIQAGTLRGFPPSAMEAHVSASPGHQSLRTSLIESRFDIAAFGTLGYELDLNSLSEMDQEAVRRQIAFYKEHRKLLQFGTFRPLTPADADPVWWTVTDGRTTIAMEAVKRNRVHPGCCDRLRIPFLRKDRRYRIRNRRIIMPKEFFGDLYGKYGKEENEETDIIVSGSILSTCGIALEPQFMGNGIQPGIRVIGDNGTRMYIIEEL